MEDDTRINPDPEFTYNATNIVLSLPEDLLSEVRCTYIGNWYSSVELLHELGKRSSDVIGTVWKDCKALPKDAVNAFTFLDKIKGLKDTKMGTRQVFCKDIKPQAKASNKRRIHLWGISFSVAWLTFSSICTVHNRLKSLKFTQ